MHQDLGAPVRRFCWRRELNSYTNHWTLNSLLFPLMMCLLSSQEMHTFGRSDSRQEGRQFCIPKGWTFIGFTGGTGGHLHHLGVVIKKNSAALSGLGGMDMAGIATSASVYNPPNPANSLPASLLSPSSSSSSSVISCTTNIPLGNQTGDQTWDIGSVTPRFLISFTIFYLHSTDYFSPFILISEHIQLPR